MIMALMTTVLSFASSTNALGQCNNITAVQTEGSCTRHFTFSDKLTANIDIALSYSFDFGDGYVLTGSFMSITSAFAPTHYDPNLGFHRTSGHYNDVYHYYCNPGETYTYTIDIVYIDQKGITKTFHCTDSFVFDPFYGGCSCNTSGECNFTMTNSSDCANTSISFEGADYAVLYTHEYWFNDDLVHSSVNPDWTFDVENFNNCDDIEVRYLVKDANGDIICEVSKPLDLAKGLYIGNHDCTPVYLSDLIADGILPANEYGSSCDIYVTGEVIIDQDYTFAGTIFHFDSGAGLTVANSVAGSSTVDLTLKEAHLSSCAELWRGIRVYQGCTLTATASDIEDALYAIRPMNVIDGSTKPKISMEANHLNNNFVGILAVDGEFIMQQFASNSFLGGNILPLSTSGCPIENILSVPGFPVGNRSYAGIFVDGKPYYTQANILDAQLNLQNVSFSNSFDGFSCGINARSGNHIVSGCNFYNIDSYGYNINAGVGINFIDNSGANFFKVLNGIFDNVKQGIVAVSFSGPNTKISVSHTKMINMGGGIAVQDGSYLYNGSLVQTGGFSYGFIFDNIINMNWNNPNTGIWVRDIDPGLTAFNVRDNDITANSDGSNGIWFDTGNGKPIGTIIGEGGSMNPCLSSPSNTVTLNGSGVGIRLQNSHFMRVDKNTVSMNSGGFGIHTTSSNAFHNLSINCNCITGTGGWTQGFIQSGGTSTRTRTTYLNNTNVGLTFQGACPDAVIEQNKIGVNGGQMNIGLRYVMANTGEQFDRGNRWRGSFGIGADGGSTNSSTWKVFNGNNQMPPSVIPNLGWFLSSMVDVPEISCTAGSPVPPPTTPQLSQSDYDFMTGQLTFSVSGLDWDMRASILTKVQESPDLLNDPIVQSFYASPDNVEVLDALSLRQASQDLFDIAPSQQTDLDDISMQIENTIVAMDTLDSMIIANPTDMALLTNYSQLKATLQGLQTAYQDVWANVLTARQSVATTVLGQWASYSPGAISGQFMATAWSGYLKVKALGQSLTAGELDALREIALTCPEKGGSTVHFASGLYSALTGESLAIGQCPKAGQKVKLPTSSATNTIAIAPNPGNKELILSMPKLSDAEYTVTIMTLTGKTMDSRTSNDSKIVLNTSSLPEGIYMIHVFDERGEINQVLRWVKSK